jgi:hypothetical protein
MEGKLATILQIPANVGRPKEPPWKSPTAIRFALGYPARCNVPAASLADYESNPGNTVILQKLIMEYMATALALDMTQVATFHMTNRQNYPFLNLGGCDTKSHDLQHTLSSWESLSGMNARYLSRVHRWHAEGVKYLIDLLKAYSIYDQTVLLWVTELGRGAGGHPTTHFGFMLGGGGGTWKKQRYIKFDPVRSKTYIDRRTDDKSVAYQRVHTSIVNQFGMKLEHFGDPDFKGDLPRLMG